MHRSATSLAASALRQAGVDLGQQLIGARRGNPRGHFEDWDFHDLHERMLAAAGHTPFSAEGDLSSRLGESFLRQADALIASRQGLELWGWKNPRTCLFLEFWESVLPTAHYVFVYRHPADVALSLLRRDADPEARRDPAAAIRSWEVHNRLLLAFRDRHPDRCFLAHGPTAAADLSAFVRRVAAQLQLPLQADGVDSLFVPEELTPSVAGRGADWEELILPATALYRRLESRADLPTHAADVAAGGAAIAAAAISSWEAELQEASARLLSGLLEGGQARAGSPRRSQRHASKGARAESVQHGVEFDDSAKSATLAATRDHERQRLAQSRSEHSRIALQLEEARERGDALAATLAAIEESRSFALIRAWWRLRFHLRGRFNRRRSPDPSRAIPERGDERALSDA